MYNGVSRQIAKYYNCDHSVIDKLKRNDIYKNEQIDQNELRNLIEQLQLSDDNLNENYHPHNIRKLDEEKTLEILSVILTESGYDRLIADIFTIDTKLLYRLKNGNIYKDYLEKYNSLTEKEKQLLKQSTMDKYNLEHLRLSRKRNNKQSSLTQEQVNYILDNIKTKKQIEIAKDLNISADRVSSVVRGKSYKDLIANYYSSK